MYNRTVRVEIHAGYRPSTNEMSIEAGIYTHGGEGCLTWYHPGLTDTDRDSHLCDSSCYRGRIKSNQV